MLKTVGFPSTRTGDQTIVNGNLVIGTAGKGIDFSATPGTGTSELLADYEEGTWTATLKGSVSDPTTPVTTTGRYTKIGDTVHIWCSFANFNATGGAGNITVIGVPFASGGVRTLGAVYVGSLPIVFSYIASYFSDSSSTISFLDVQNSAYGGNLQFSAGAGKYLEFSLTYKV